MIFFILVGAKYCSIYHIDVCQGKNTSNTDIHISLNNLPTTQKDVANDIIKSGIENYPHGYRHIYMGNQYDSIQLCALMKINYDLRAVGTFISNRKGIDSEHLLLDKNLDKNIQNIG